jgi:integrase/recombinase XerD
MRREIRSATVTLKHVQTVTKGGKTYRYLRLPGQPRLALPDLPPDHPDFLRAYADAVKAAPKSLRAKAGTIRSVIEAFQRCDKWKLLSQGYRGIMVRHFSQIAEQADDARMIDLRAAHIQDDLRALTPIQARDRLKAWRLICGHALDLHLIGADPSEAVRRPDPIRHTGHPAWTRAQIDAFRARWPIGTPARAVMELLFWTGARISDACQIGPQHVARDGVLSFPQRKTGDTAFIPWTCPLPAHARAMLPDRDMMHAALDALPGRNLTYLATRAGRTRSEKSAGHLIAKAAEAAGFDRSAHGLRKSRAVALAEAGANPLQIGAWTGHRSLSEVAHYAEEADRRKQVIGTEQDRNPVNPPNLSVNRPTSA